MRIYSDEDLNHFQFWSGGKDRADLLTYDELNQVEQILEDCYPEGMSDTQLNGLFWFDFGTVCEWLGLDEDEVLNRD